MWLVMFWISIVVYVTRFYRTDPNRTSGKIKLTPPVDSYTIVLQVLTLSTTQTKRGWFLLTSFLGGVECSNGGFRPCEEPGLARVSGLLVDSLIMLARRVLCWFCYISATKEPAQPCNLVSGLQSWSASILRSNFCPPRHPPASTPLWALVILLHSSNCSDFLSYLAGNCTSSYKYWKWLER